MRTGDSIHSHRVGRLHSSEQCTRRVRIASQTIRSTSTFCALVWFNCQLRRGWKSALANIAHVREGVPRYLCREFSVAVEVPSPALQRPAAASVTRFRRAPMMHDHPCLFISYAPHAIGFLRYCIAGCCMYARAPLITSQRGN